MPRTRGQSTLSAQSRSSTPHHEPPERIPRPSNSFILYRTHSWMERKEQLEHANAVETMANFGRYIGPRWKSEPGEVRAYWKAKAAEEKRKHKAKYPDYVFRPNRGSGSGGEKPKRAPCKPKDKPIERKEATPSPAQRSVTTRSMAQQKQAAAVRTGAQEMKTNADGQRGITARRGDRQQTRSMSCESTVEVESDVVQSDQEAVQPRPGAVGGEISPSMAGLLLAGGGGFPTGFDLLADGGVSPSRFDLLPPLGDPVADEAFPVHLRSLDAFDENNLAPSESEEHDRPSLWDSDLPLFPREILEEDDYSGEYGARGVPRDWRQPTFLPDFGYDSSQPVIDPLLANWPTGGQYLNQSLGPLVEPRDWIAYA